MAGNALAGDVSWSFTTASSGGGAPGLVAGYHFDEGSGSTVADSSGNDNTGTISGATWTTAGKFGNALVFNGTSNRVNVPDANSLDLTNGMTLEAWVYPTTLSGWNSVILKERGSNGLAYALYANDNGSRPSGYVRIGSDRSVRGNGALPLNTWTHLAVTYDGAFLRLYQNGVEVGSRAQTGNITTSSQALQIGGNTVWGEYFSGRIDEVHIYNRALTATEIQNELQVFDTTAPTVTVMTPANGASDVGIGAVVTATFSEALDPATVTGQTFELRDGTNTVVAATVSYAAATQTATLTPSAPLATLSTYTATLKGGATDPRVKDVAGNALAGDVSWSFTTTAGDITAPTVTAMTPVNGASDVAIGSAVTATFSEALDPATVTGQTFELRDGTNTVVAATCQLRGGDADGDADAECAVGHAEHLHGDPEGWGDGSAGQGCGGQRPGG